MAPLANRACTRAAHRAGRGPRCVGVRGGAARQPLGDGVVRRHRGRGERAREPPDHRAGRRVRRTALCTHPARAGRTGGGTGGRGGRTRARRPRPANRYPRGDRDRHTCGLRRDAHGAGPRSVRRATVCAAGRGSGIPRCRRRDDAAHAPTQHRHHAHARRASRALARRHAHRARLGRAGAAHRDRHPRQRGVAAGHGRQRGDCRHCDRAGSIRTGGPARPRGSHRRAGRS